MGNLRKEIDNGKFKYIIRESRPEDFEQIFEIWIKHQIFDHKLIPKSKDFFYKAFINQDDNFKYFVAINNTEYIGFQSLTSFREKNFFKSYYAESSTYVKSSFMNSSAGQDLVKYAMEHARDSDIKYIYGWINNDAQKLIHLATKLNWNVIGDIPSSNKGNGETEKKLLVYKVPKTIK
ncbi:MAG: GNAT family N-acetyltransferase [Chitinophagales bacterium]|nr:GNAT family N-acetyltransferase [Chitinophagales bacterium]